MFLLKIDSGQQLTIYKVSSARHAADEAGVRGDMKEALVELSTYGEYTDDEFSRWLLRDALVEDLDLTKEG